MPFQYALPRAYLRDVEHPIIPHDWLVSYLITVLHVADNHLPTSLYRPQHYRNQETHLKQNGNQRSSLVQWGRYSEPYNVKEHKQAGLLFRCRSQWMHTTWMRAQHTGLGASHENRPLEPRTSAHCDLQHSTLIGSALTPRGGGYS
jgi:hypothetical protein